MISFDLEVTRKEKALLIVAVRLRAEACEENAEHNRFAKEEGARWRALLAKLEKAKLSRRIGS